MNKITGITVSKNYSDLLSIAIDNNHDLFDEWYIVTQEDDEETISLILQRGYKNIKLLFYPLVPELSKPEHTPCPYLDDKIIAANQHMNYTDKVIFDKGGAIKYAQINHTSEGDTVLYIDSDIVIPEKTKNFIKRNKFKSGILYGAHRYDYETYEDFMLQKNGKLYADAHGGKQYRARHIDGYFHLYVNKGITYDRSESAAYPDTWFKYKYCKSVRGDTKLRVGDKIIFPTKTLWNRSQPIKDVKKTLTIKEVIENEQGVISHVGVEGLGSHLRKKVHATEILTSETDEGLAVLPEQYQVCHLGESGGDWTKRVKNDFQHK